MQIFANALQQSPYRRFLPLYALVGVLLLLSFVTRVALLARPDSAVPLTVLHLAHIFGVGLLFDLVAASYFCLPLALYLTLLPNRVAARHSVERVWNVRSSADAVIVCVLMRGLSRTRRLMSTPTPPGQVQRLT